MWLHWTETIVWRVWVYGGAFVQSPFQYASRNHRDRMQTWPQPRCSIVCRMHEIVVTLAATRPMQADLCKDLCYCRRSP